MTVRFRDCPRCRGDLYLETDDLTHQDEFVCLQCSHRAPAQTKVIEFPRRDRALQGPRRGLEAL